MVPAVLVWMGGLHRGGAGREKKLNFPERPVSHRYRKNWSVAIGQLMVGCWRVDYGIVVVSQGGAVSPTDPTRRVSFCGIRLLFACNSTSCDCAIAAAFQCDAASPAAPIRRVGFGCILHVSAHHSSHCLVIC